MKINKNVKMSCICVNIEKKNYIQYLCMYVNKVFSNLVWKTNKKNETKYIHKFMIYKLVRAL